MPVSVTTFVFASKGGSAHIRDAHCIPATTDERAKLGTTWFSLRGELLRNLTETVDQNDLVNIAEEAERANEFQP